MNLNQNFKSFYDYEPNSAPTRQQGHGRVGDLYSSLPEYDTKSQENVDYKFQNNALTGIQETTPLSNLFFSNNNVQRIQKDIIQNVYRKSNGKYKIGNQSQDELLIIMRSIFLQKSLNLNNNIEQQCLQLNKFVVDFSTEQIIPAIELYMYYQKDIASNPVPIEHPKNMSMAGTKSRKFKSFI
jgi:hypothetical protein